MLIIEPSTEILAYTPNLEQIIELAGRTCYKSEDKINSESAPKFVSKIRSINHESVLEHGSITVRFICDRGVSHELVRHRIASFSQESTRYCNYFKDKFENQITVVAPLLGGFAFERWKASCEEAERAYFELLNFGCKPQDARSVLPNSLKTEIVMTTNPREWRHVFRLRCAEAAHPQMRQIMRPLHVDFIRRWPSLFGDE